MLITIQADDLRCDEHDRGHAWYVVVRADDEHFVTHLCNLCLTDLLNRWKLVGAKEACKRLKTKRWIGS